VVKRLAEQSLYEILEISRDASPDEVAKAYERAKALYGPGSLATYTLMPPEDAALLTRRIEEARSVLTDPTMRADYDAHLATGGAAVREVRPPPAGATAHLPPIIPPVRAPPPGGAAEIPAAPPPPVAPAAPQPRAPPPFSHPEGSPWTGEVLRRARESRGLTLQQLSERTKITRHHLENVEADRHDRLPAPVYLRGMLMSVAKELRLDGQKVARSYLDAVAAATQTAPEPKVR
jgi:curved DNA-binding protein CbpA